MGQTIGKATRGGVDDGFARLAYQVGISGVVILAPSAAAAKHNPSATTRITNEFVLKGIAGPELWHDDDAPGLRERGPTRRGMLEGGAPGLPAEDGIAPGSP